MCIVHNVLKILTRNGMSFIFTKRTSDDRVADIIVFINIRILIINAERFVPISIRVVLLLIIIILYYFIVHGIL